MIDSPREYARKELNAWERGFLDSVETQLAINWFLTRGSGRSSKELHAEHLG